MREKNYHLYLNEALAVSLGEKATIDMDYMMELCSSFHCTGRGN